MKIIVLAASIATAFALFSGCGSSSGNDSNAGSSTGLTSSSASSSAGIVAIGAVQDVNLSAGLNTPVRIISDQNGLTQLYIDLGIEKDPVIAPDFSNDVVVYLQRTGHSGFDANVSQSEEGVRVTSSITQEIGDEYRKKIMGKILLLSRGAGVPIAFTKQTHLYESCQNDASRGGELGAFDLNQSISIGTYSANATENYLAEAMYDQNETERIAAVYGVEDSVPQIDFSKVSVAASGVVIGTDSRSAGIPYLQKITDVEGVGCDYGLDQSFAEFTFAFDLVRSDCPDFSQNNPQVLFVGIGDDTLNELQIGFLHGLMTAQNISVKSCTYYSATPLSEKMGWFSGGETSVVP